jgi:hypothetical protein
MHQDSIIQERVRSIAAAEALPEAITGVQTFKLTSLELTENKQLELPTNLRLGHLAERVVSHLIKTSNNYKLLFENIQLTENNTTIGELDFILQNTYNKQVIHLELAYKFYLYDPRISSNQIENWIGPNRNDSLVKKLKKLHQKQFPLIFHPSAQHFLKEIKPAEITQALCFLVSLYVPNGYKEILPLPFQQAIRGYYTDYETFQEMDSVEKHYYLPPRRFWGMAPSNHKTWNAFSEIQPQLAHILRDNKAALCWEQRNGSFAEYFIVPWELP